MKKQLLSFKHAFEGIISAVRTEPHMRFHLVAAFYVFLFAFLGRFNITQWVILILTVSLVIGAELVNTAVERLCDLYSKKEDKNIKFIKDVSAGAVLVCAVGAAVTALFLFVFTGKLRDALFLLVFEHPLWLIPLGISAVLSVLFIILTGRKNKDK